jgi:hypothetical protein
MLICNEYYLTLIVNLIFFFETHSICNEYYLTLFFLFLMFNKNFICIIGFFNTNLYNFILFILNNVFKKYLKIITEGFINGHYPSAFDREREMPIVSMNLQTECFRRPFTVAWCKCHNHRCIYRRINYVGISHTHRQLY